ncbi:MAG TPA: ROK family protein [Myxococcota bacterium]|nr:ROK family protein [Myxococcota bacterium]
MRIGLDLGGTKISGIVMDDARRTLQSRRIASPAAGAAAPYEAVVDAIVALVLELEAAVGAPCRVGIGTPGALSPHSGVMKNCNSTCLNGRPLGDDLERRLARPLRMDNDANCFALSEATDGAAREHPVVFGVIIGTGTGGGIAMHGHVHRGRHGIAGEWGHTPLESDGPPCYCGRRGCVETFLSGPGLLADYRRSGGARAQTAAEVARLDADGADALATAAVDRYVERFGRAMATVIDVLDPDAIVLGGGVSNTRRLYRDLPAAVARHVFNDAFTTPILPHAHGDDSGVRGAAMLWET